MYSTYQQQQTYSTYQQKQTITPCVAYSPPYNMYHEVELRSQEY